MVSGRIRSFLKKYTKMCMHCRKQLTLNLRVYHSLTNNLSTIETYRLYISVCRAVLSRSFHSFTLAAPSTRQSMNFSPAFTLPPYSTSPEKALDVSKTNTTTNGFPWRTITPQISAATSKRQQTLSVSTDCKVDCIKGLLVWTREKFYKIEELIDPKVLNDIEPHDPRLVVPNRSITSPTLKPKSGNDKFCSQSWVRCGSVQINKSWVIQIFYLIHYFQVIGFFKLKDCCNQIQIHSLVNFKAKIQEFNKFVVHLKIPRFQL